MLRLGLGASLTMLATGALATPFCVPADDASWTITPRYFRALDEIYGSFLFNGTQLQLFGAAVPVDTQIFMDGEQRGDIPDTLDPTGCVPCAEWEGLDERTHNLTIIAPLNGTRFLIVNATGTTAAAFENTPPGPIASSISLAHYPSSSAKQSSYPSTTAPASAVPTPVLNTGLLILGLVGLLALFLAACFGLYYYTRVRTRAKKQHPAAIIRGRSFESTHEIKYVLMYATDTVGGVKV